MLLPVLLLAQMEAVTPTEALRPAEPSTLVLALIGLGTLVLYQLITRKTAAKRLSGSGSDTVVTSAEKHKKRAA